MGHPLSRWTTLSAARNPPTLEGANTPNGNCTTPPYNVGPAQIVANIPWSGTNAANNLCQSRRSCRTW